jgi:hypothetical protein
VIAAFRNPLFAFFAARQDSRTVRGSHVSSFSYYHSFVCCYLIRSGRDRSCFLLWWKRSWNDVCSPNQALRKHRDG